MDTSITKCIRISPNDVIKLEEIKLAGRKKGLFISNQSLVEKAINNYLTNFTAEEIIAGFEAEKV